jgi:hypothetical protein
MAKTATAGIHPDCETSPRTCARVWRPDIPSRDTAGLPRLTGAASKVARFVDASAICLGKAPASIPILIRKGWHLRTTDGGEDGGQLHYTLLILEFDDETIERLEKRNTYP